MAPSSTQAAKTAMRRGLPNPDSRVAILSRIFETLLFMTPPRQELIVNQEYAASSMPATKSCGTGKAAALTSCQCSDVSFDIAGRLQFRFAQTVKTLWAKT